MQIGVDSFASVFPDPKSGTPASPADRLDNLLEQIRLADQVGLDVFGIGEHHRADSLDSAPAVILAAAAATTKSIRLTSAVTVLSAADPVRVFQQFATLDLLARGRAELIVGRGSSVDAFPLFGFRLEDYDALFIEKLQLLLQLREDAHPHWSGSYRPALTGQGIYPRSFQARIPVWLGVGGTPQSFVRAGTLGLPLMIAIIGGDFGRFRPLIDLYWEAGAHAGHSKQQLQVGIHAMGFVADTFKAATDAFFPGWAQAFTKIGKERGWAPVNRSQFDAMCGPEGAFLIGDPDMVVQKLIHANSVLGGISRIAFQMSSAASEHDAMKRSIVLLGTEVAPRIRGLRALSSDASGRPRI